MSRARSARWKFRCSPRQQCGQGHMSDKTSPSCEHPLRHWEAPSTLPRFVGFEAGRGSRAVDVQPLAPLCSAKLPRTPRAIQTTRRAGPASVGIRERRCPLSNSATDGTAGPMASVRRTAPHFPRESSGRSSPGCLCRPAPTPARQAIAAEAPRRSPEPARHQARSGARAAHSGSPPRRSPPAEAPPRPA
jgi:hypothetical protein